MANIFKPEWDAKSDEAPFRWRRARIGRQTGAEQLGASLFEIAPGDATFPLHAHYANEEMLFVLSGTPTLLTPDTERILQPGEAVAFKAGREGAHRIDNRTKSPARVLIVSTMKAPEINEMLEDRIFRIRDYAPGVDPPMGSVDVRVPMPD
jgi:uncharacterized cupin superfamily protein